MRTLLVLAVIATLCITSTDSKDVQELGDATIPKGIKGDWLPGSYFEPITNKKGPQVYEKFKVPFCPFGLSDETIPLPPF